MSARFVHRVTAMGLLVFIAVHLGVHMTGAFGIAAHDAALNAARRFYRPQLLEIALLSAFALQIALGARLFVKRWAQRRKSAWSWVQLFSGAYIALFVILHAGAALTARSEWDLDTNFYWPAGTLTIEPLVYGFAPYYMLGVVAVFAHIGAALHFAGVKRWPHRMLALGGLIGAGVIAIFSGFFYEIVLPEGYEAYFCAHPVNMTCEPTAAID